MEAWEKQDVADDTHPLLRSGVSFSQKLKDAFRPKKERSILRYIREDIGGTNKIKASSCYFDINDLKQLDKHQTKVREIAIGAFSARFQPYRTQLEY
jgi:hypothetical protein